MRPVEGAAGRDLEELVRVYRLPAGWTAPECFVDEVAAGGWSIHLVGLISRDSNGAEATGSAADVSGFPLARAYFELLERTSLLAMTADPEARPVVRDRTGEVVGTCPREVAFPRAPPGAPWAYARSNGVALGRSLEAACRSAELELVERDRVLRSWYGETRPIALPDWRFESPPGPDAIYAFQAYEFPSPAGQAETGAHSIVAGVFGFPVADQRFPLVYGFGAGTARTEALAHAARECQQRLGFLLGEEIPAAMPAFATTADFHQDYYLWPRMHERLRIWLTGGHTIHARTLARPDGPGTGRLFLDLTPKTGLRDLRVVRALPGPEIPLVFGRGHPWASRAVPEQLQVHPIP
jgi:hypothetical protein